MTAPRWCCATRRIESAKNRSLTVTALFVASLSVLEECPHEKRAWVAVGMPVTRHPPHRPVLAQLTHTVPTSDKFGVKARCRVRVQDRDLGEQDCQTLLKTFPGPAAFLTAPPKLA